MNLTFKQLEAFCFSARLQSFSAAAQKLHTTQSAMSKRVAELEDTLGVSLLHRTPRGLEITQAGRQLLPLAEDSQRLWQRIETEVSADQTLRGTFRIGVTELIAMTWLTRFIKRLQELHPELVLEPVVDAGLTLFQGLESNKIDLAIMPGTFWGASYTTTKVGQVQDLWMASPALKLPRRALKPHEFAHYPILEQSTGAAKNKFYEAWMAEHGFRFNKVFATNSTTVLRELTISELALDYARPDIAAGLLRIVRSDPMPPPMVYSAVYRNDNFSPALERMVALGIEICDFSSRANAPAGAVAAGKPRRLRGVAG
jgi:DNA-binding transcriptional LysR family regulator